MRAVFHILVLSVVVFCLTGCVSETLSVGTGELTSSRDIAYGPSPKQKYNIFRPVNQKPDASVVVFFHGGAWQRGSYKQYSLVGKALAKQGHIAVIAGYRTFPDAIFPGFVDDAARAVAAIKKQVSPDKPVFLMGHSAGAHIAALLTVDKKYLAKHGLDVCKSVAGLAGIAGPYDFNPPNRGTFSKIFPRNLISASKPISFRPGSFPPILLLHGETDRTVPTGHSRRFHARLKNFGGNAELKVYPRVGHVGILGAYSTIGSSSATTVEDINSFIRRYAGARRNTCR